MVAGGVGRLEVDQHQVEVAPGEQSHWLGNPAFDPHGDPIPQASGKITARRLVGLDAAAPGPATVARITDDSPDFLRFVDQHGLTPSAAVTVAAHDPVGQTVTLEQPGGGSVQLGHGAAAKILVEAG